MTVQPKVIDLRKSWRQSASQRLAAHLNGVLQSLVVYHPSHFGREQVFLH